MAEEGDAQDVPAEPVEVTAPAQQTEEVQEKESSPAAESDLESAQAAGATEQPPAADTPEGPADGGEAGAEEERSAPNPDSADDQQLAATGEEDAVQPTDTGPEPGGGEGGPQTERDAGDDGAGPQRSQAVPEEGEGGAPATEGPATDAPAVREGQQEADWAAGETTTGEKAAVPENETLVVSGVDSQLPGDEEKDAGVTDTASQRSEEEENEGGTEEQATDRGSVENTTATLAEDKITTDRSSAESSRHSSAEEATTPGSAGSGDGRSLTRLVERSSLEQQHRALLLLRRQLLTRNQRLQQRLSQHFSRKTDDGAERVEKNLGELEARYSRYLSGIREQQRLTAEERERRQQELTAFRVQVEQQTEMVAAAYSAAVDLRRQVALKSRSSRTGRLMAAAEVEALIGREQQKEVEVQEARLESLRRETRLGRLEQTLRESEELAGGIHLIDFEQLKIENQTYAEKIEERNEDLTKLRRKISSTVQILTHLKERIQFEQAENTRRQEHLRTVSAEVTHGRESLAQLKQRRDQVRSRTASQRATAGLLGHEALLRDFEARVDEEGRLVRELQALKREYADHQRMTQDIRQAVRARKQQQFDKRKTASRH